MLNIRKFFEGIGIVPKTTTSVDSQGELEVLTSDGKLRYHNGTSVSPVVTETHTATLTNKTIDADLNTITNIENGDIKANAGIDAAKIGNGNVSNTEYEYLDGVTSNIQVQLDSKASNTLTNAHIYVGNASNVATDVAVSGDVTITNTGDVQIAAGVIVNADVNASAAIDFSKLAALPSANILVGNGSNVATAVAMSGDVVISNAGATTIQNNVVSNAKLAQMGANTIKGNNTGSTANAADLSIAQVLTMLGLRAGTQSLGSGVSTVSVTLSTAYSGTGYAIHAQLINTSDTNPQFQPVTISAQSASGFSIKLNAPTDSANYSIQYITVLNN